MELHTERENLLNNISITKEKLNQLVENYNKFNSLYKSPVRLKWWHHLILYFVLFFVFSYVFELILWPFLLLFGIGVPSDPLATIFVAIYFVLFTFLYVRGYIWYAKYSEKKANQKINEHADLVNYLATQKEQLLQEIETNSIVPAKYRTYQALSKFEDYIMNRRADSLKEAINLYEQERKHEEHLQELKVLRELQEATYQKANEASTLDWINLFTRR